MRRNNDMARTNEATHGGYVSRVHRYQRLSREREHELAERWCRHGDTSARDALVRAQLQNVVIIARRYRRHDYATLDDLIAEGNLGLVQAIARFDPCRGTRFVTYAVYWIRAYISQYLVRSRSLVATGVQSKALSKIRRARDNNLKAIGDVGDADEQIAQQLAISADKFRSLSERLEVHDLPWEATMEDTPSGLPLEILESRSASVEDQLLSAELIRGLSRAVSEIVSLLDEGERYIVERRIMAHREEELSLAEIGRRLGVSREQARQLEARVMRKVKSALLQLPAGADWIAGCRAA
jgi:RNA polymerase sigma-32 factor